jgi:hypothetical protein
MAESSSPVVIPTSSVPPVTPVAPVPPVQNIQPVIPPNSSVPPNVPPPVSVSQKMPLWGWVTVVIGGLMVIVFSVYLLLPKNKIAISNPVANPLLHVDQLVLRKPGFLVLLLSSPVKGRGVIRYTPYLLPDTYNGFDVTLNESELIEVGDSAYATIYEDTDNSEDFDENIDQEMRDMFGRPTRVNFKILSIL